ncbi:MAG: glutamine synthetase type III, partial [Clostridia bacterium]|nr:glutamine synthetase type III [Clostridia bacterium]
NGDGYSEEWQAEAEKRGLLNLRSTVDAVPHFKDLKNIELFERHGVLNRTEINIRADITLDNYSQILNIEALTLIGMIQRDIIPGIGKHIEYLCRLAAGKRDVCDGINITPEKDMIKKLSDDTARLGELNEQLREAVDIAEKISDLEEKARYYHDEILSLMENIRSITDSDEEVVATEYWPYPHYSELLFKI